jgi:hypothetical protein
MKIRIRMKSLAAGPNGVRHVGRVYEVSQQEADDLIAGGYAELASGASSPETAALSGGAERAMMPAATRR